VFDRRAFIELRFEPKLSDKTRLFTRLFWDHTKYIGEYPLDADSETFFDEDYNSNGLGLEGRVIHQISDPLELQVGALASYILENKLTNKDRGAAELTLDEDHPSFDFALYAAGAWRPSDKVALHLGLRFDGHVLMQGEGGEPGAPEEPYVGFHGAASPRLALIVKPADDTVLKVLAGTAYRSPSVYELAFNDGGLTQVSPDNLADETSYSAEIEVTQRILADVVATAAVYFNVFSNGVTLSGDGTEEVPLLYFNRGRPLTSGGFEAEVRHELRRGMSYALTWSIMRARDGDFFGDAELTNSPSQVLGLKMIVPLVGASLSLVARRHRGGPKEGAYTDASVIWDMGLWGRVSAINGEFNLIFRNLLDWKHEQRAAGSSPTRVCVSRVRASRPTSRCASKNRVRRFARTGRAAWPFLPRRRDRTRSAQSCVPRLLKGRDAVGKGPSIAFGRLGQGLALGSDVTRSGEAPMSTQTWTEADCPPAFASLPDPVRGHALAYANTELEAGRNPERALSFGIARALATDDDALGADATGIFIQPGNNAWVIFSDAGEERYTFVDYEDALRRGGEIARARHLPLVVVNLEGGVIESWEFSEKGGDSALHLQPGADGRWFVRGPDGLSESPTRKHAFEAARERAKALDVDLIIHFRGGAVERRTHFAKDAA